MATIGNCDFCGEPVDGAWSYMYQAQGWAPKRSGGGTNRLLGEKKLGPVAHTQCAVKADKLKRRGISPNQANLGV